MEQVRASNRFEATAVVSPGYGHSTEVHDLYSARWMAVLSMVESRRAAAPIGGVVCCGRIGDRRQSATPATTELAAPAQTASLMDRTTI